MPKEVWKDVVGYEGLYEVSSRGMVRVKLDGNGNPPPRKKKGVKKARLGNSCRYKRVTLMKDDKQKTWFVHSLVSLAFIGPRADGAHIHHVNGDPTDNRVENLQYMTPAQHARAESGRSCITDAETQVIRLLCQLGFSQRYACKVLGLHHNAAHFVMSGERVSDIEVFCGSTISGDGS